MTALTKKTNKATVDETKVDPAIDAYLRAEHIVQVINDNMPEAGRKLVPIPKSMPLRKANRETVSTAVHAAFQLIGGLPNFVEWAAHNPEKFYTNIWAKLLPTDTETAVGNNTFVFQSAIPASPLDRVNVNSAGFVTIDAETDDLPE